MKSESGLSPKLFWSWVIAIIAVIFILFVMSNCNNDKPLDKIVNLSSVDGIPITKAKINGKSVYLIVDTGASISVLDKNQSSSLGFKSVADEEFTGIAGYGGNSQMENTDVKHIEIDGYELKGTFRCQDISNIVYVVKKAQGFTISGILGTNVMRTYKFGFNFRDNLMTFEPL